MLHYASQANPVLVQNTPISSWLPRGSSFFINCFVPTQPKSIKETIWFAVFEMNVMQSVWFPHLTLVVFHTCLLLCYLPITPILDGHTCKRVLYVPNITIKLDSLYFAMLLTY